MKKFLVYMAVVALFMSVGVMRVAALMPIFEPIIVPIDCTVFGTCAVYVDDKANPSVTPAGTKTDWFESITDAVAKVKTDADYNTIIIAQGNYSLNGTPEAMPFEFSDVDTWGSSMGVYIYGGYAEGFATRDADTYRTVIDGNDAVNNVFKIENLSGKISGIEFTNVNGNGSAPVHVSNKGATSYSFTVEYNKFYGNELGLGSHSMVIDLAGSNKASVYGNEITDNVGGGLNSTASFVGNVDVHNNIFSGNTAWTGIGCSGATVYNNYFLDNSVNQVVNAYGNCNLYNNTIAGNTINAGASYAAVVMSASTNKVANNLIADNDGNQPFVHSAGDTSVFEYNAMNGNGSDPAAGSLADGNLLCDPLFTGSNYSNPEHMILGEGSECIDKGKVVSAVTDDYFDTARPLDGDGVGGAQYDPGAYEAPAYVAPDPSVGPQISGLGVSPATFSPNSDGVQDETTIAFNISDNADVTVTILNSSDVELKKLINSEPKSAGSHLLTWDGKNALNQVVEDGTYKVRVYVSNAIGNDTEEVNVVVNTDVSGQCAGYTDVPADHASCDAIEYLQSIGAMTGNPDGTFAPDESLQRDQVAKIVLETFGLFDGAEDYCAGTDPFPDVEESAWAYQYICRGVELGMITGYEAGEDEGYYRPARSVNRVEFLALTLRNLSDTMPGLNSTSYNDVEAGQWFSGYAKYSYDNDLFTGANLYPSQYTKRSEVADVIYELHTLGKI